MNTDQLQHINRERHADLQENILGVTRHFSVRSIHAFRVAYKKLRAFLRMVSSMKDVSHVCRIPKNIRRAYRYAGKIRDLQLQFRKIRGSALRHEPHARYGVEVKKEIAETRKKLLDKLAKSKPVASQRKIGKALPHRFTSKDLEIFAGKKWAGISLALQSVESDKSIHDLRKHLKDLYYVHEMMKAQKVPGEENVLLRGKSQKFISECTGVLGKLQDGVSAVSLIDNFSGEKKHWHISIPLEAVREGWLKDIKNNRRLLEKKFSGKLANP